MPWQARLLYTGDNCMTDLPISFSPPMVRALLDERKKMTRMELNPAKGYKDHPYVMWPIYEQGRRLKGCGSANPDRAAPYTSGDRLYVREPWQALAEYDHLSPKDIPVGSNILYIADREDSPWDARRRHSWFMCRWMSRITLTVTDVRVERLQDISGDDCFAEGIGETHFYENAEAKVSAGAPWSPERLAFADLWNALHGPGSWEANPWVAAISFTTRMGNING
jgi:hypothetical protein